MITKLALCLAFVATVYANDKLDMFNNIDRNGDQYLSQAEINQLFQNFDINGDGKVSKYEHRYHFVGLYQLGTAEQADGIFDAGDVNGDGFIEPSEGPAIMNHLDTDQDGQLSYIEYLHIWA